MPGYMNGKEGRMPKLFNVRVYYKKADRPFKEELDSFIVSANNEDEAEIMADEMAMERILCKVDNDMEFTKEVNNDI